MSLATAVIPGVTFDLPRGQYDRMEGANFSRLKLMAKSPLHYRHGDSKETGARLRGIGAHCAVYEPERFTRDFLVYTGGKVRNGKKWDAFKAKNEGATFITKTQRAAVERIATAVRGDRFAAPYIQRGRSEVTLQWTHREPELAGVPGFEILCKGRPDFLSELDVLADLKTTPSVEEEAFKKAAFNLKLHVQAAFYVDGLEALTGKRLPYKVIAVEATPPHAVVVYTVPERLLEQGREVYRAWLQRLHDCRTANHWPGPADHELELDLPRWAGGGDSAEDMSGLGLDFDSDEEAA